MKARAFDYIRADTLEAALSAYGACEGEARYLAGGQSLLAALNLRLDAPDLLIDIAHIASLRGIEREGDAIRIGALTRHAEVLSSPLVAAHAPLLSDAAAYVAHPAIRNKGTFGGSLALADPASEFPAVVLALDGRIEITGPTGVREVAADAFFLDLYETALEPGEIISAVRIPVVTSSHHSSFQELARRRGDYAMVGLAAHASVEHARIAAIRIVFFAVGPTPMRAPHAEATLVGRGFDAAAIAEAQAALEKDLAPEDDAQVSGTTRAHLARVILGRALADIGARATS